MTNTQSQRVFVLDQNKQPLMPCHPQRARELLTRGKAAVYRRYPFTIILKNRTGGETQNTQIKIDPGSKTTGIALVGHFKRGQKVLWGAELQHRGLNIKLSLESRRHLRSSRRSRKTRYRPARFLNRTRPKGWLPPSLMHRVLTTNTWVKRLFRYTPANLISLESVRFDTQKLMNPEINGVEYQQGELFGYEARQYLLEKFEYQCVYCGKKDIPLEIEHVIPKSKGGSNRISNLTIACHDCNQKKGNKDLKDFLKTKPETLARLSKQLKAALRDSAAVNSTRNKLREVLQSYGFLLELGTGGQTKYNRIRQNLPKEHWIDAACVGHSGRNIRVPDIQPLRIKCMGHGSRQMCRTDKYGFPNKHRTRQKIFFGFMTGDMVTGVVTTGKKKGKYVGRISVRKSGNFQVETTTGKVDGLNHRFFKTIQKNDGYNYTQ